MVQAFTYAIWHKDYLTYLSLGEWAFLNDDWNQFYP